MITRSAKETGQQKKVGTGVVVEVITPLPIMSRNSNFQSPIINTPPPPPPPPPFLVEISHSPPSPITAISEKSGGEGLGQWDKQTISLQIFWRLSSRNFTWSILEYFVTYVLFHILLSQSNFRSNLKIWTPWFSNYHSCFAEKKQIETFFVLFSIASTFWSAVR